NEQHWNHCKYISVSVFSVSVLTVILYHFPRIYMSNEHGFVSYILERNLYNNPLGNEYSFHCVEEEVEKLFPEKEKNEGLEMWQIQPLFIALPIIYAIIGVAVIFEKLFKSSFGYCEALL